jgi:allantoinase
MNYQPVRDFVGYGKNPPTIQWPNNARLALNFVINYEEGAEYSIGEGDGRSETILSEVAPSAPIAGRRDRNMESLYEYGSRVGIWRLARLFSDRKLAPTFYVVGRALELNPEVGKVIASLGSDIVCHGWRWIDYEELSEDEERGHIARTVATIRSITGIDPAGWYTGRPSLNTRRLVVEHGGFLFDSDDYNDDLPYTVVVSGRRHLVVPHSFDCNDSRFSRGSGIETGDQLYTYLSDAMEWLIAEGKEVPRMMTVSLHCRLSSRPGRINGIAKFVDLANSNPLVWICRRTDLARHWLKQVGEGQ